MTSVKDSIDGADEDAISNIILITDQIRRAQAIKKYAKEMGVSKGDVMAEMGGLDPKDNGKDTSKPDRARAHWEVAPWPAPVVGKDLFEAISDRIKSHVVLSESALLITTAWAIFTWFHDECVHSPQLLVTSPAPICGKSTLLGLLKLLTLRG